MKELIESEIQEIVRYEKPTGVNMMKQSDIDKDEEVEKELDVLS